MRIGIFIDCENQKADNFDDMIRYLSNKGKIIVKKGYAANFDIVNKLWNKKKFTQIKCDKLGKSKKNCTDISLSLDCLNDAIFLELDIIVIQTSDIDFKPLIQKINNLNKKVILIGGNDQILKNTDGNLNTYINITDTEKEVLKFIYKIRFKSFYDKKVKILTINEVLGFLKTINKNHMISSDRIKKIAEKAGCIIKDKEIHLEGLNNINLKLIS